MHIIVGSTSERKILVCQTMFARYFPGTVTATGFAAESGVPPTPHGEETFLGARRRARHSQEAGAADFHVGLESGLIERVELRGLEPRPPHCQAVMITFAQVRHRAIRSAELRVWQPANGGVTGWPVEQTFARFTAHRPDGRSMDQIAWRNVG